MNTRRRTAVAAAAAGAIALAGCSSTEAPSPAQVDDSVDAGQDAAAASPEQAATCEHLPSVSDAWAEIGPAAQSGDSAALQARIDEFLAELETLESLAAETDTPELIEPTEALRPAAEGEDFETVEASLGKLRRACSTFA